MINNSEEILTQTSVEMEEVLKKVLKDFVIKEESNDLNINNSEKIIGNAINSMISIVLSMAGMLLSNISSQDDCTCDKCNKKLRVNKKSSPITIMTLYGKLKIIRDEITCRKCGIGRGINDNLLQIDKRHRVTKGLIEIITYVGQLIPSFEEGKETIKKFMGFMGVEVSTSQIQCITKEIGKKVYEQDKKMANKIYNEPEKSIPDLLEKDKKMGTTYTLVDGSHVNTRIKDTQGSSWKEMKLVECFSDINILKRESGESLIVKKEYGATFGNVNDFKKEVLRVAIKNGYGLFKTHVILGDGAIWIWNMAKELFPNAIEILDFYHIIENTHKYAKVLHPNDEVKRHIWVKKVLHMLENGEEVAAIEFVKKNRIEDLPSGTVNLPEYLENNQNRIRYKFFRSKGYYIGSGAIESGNKTVIQQRMKQSGMRWGMKGGQYIATLRAKYKSNCWDEVANLITA